MSLLRFYITFEFSLVSSIPMMTEILPQARATLMGANVASFSLGRAKELKKKGPFVSAL